MTAARMCRGASRVVALACVSGVFAARAHANPADLIGAGARNAAMANAGVASTRDAAAAYYNPSALAWLGGAHLDLGYLASRLRLTTNDQDVSQGLLQAPYVAAAAPGTLLGHRVAGGIIVMVPSQDERPNRGAEPEFIKLERRPKRVLLGLAAAIAISDRLAIGASMQYLAGLSADVDLDGVLGYPAGEDSRIDMRLDGRVQNAHYPQVGATLRLTDAWTLAALYRHNFSYDEIQDVEIHADIGVPDLPPVIDDAYLLVQAAAIKSFQPAVAWASASWQPSERLELTADVGWMGWSKFRNPQATVHIESDFGAFSVPIKPTATRPQPEFSDVYAVKVGAEYGPRGPTSRVMLRAGYGWQSAAAGIQSGENNFIDGVLHTVAGGAGIRSNGFGLLPHPLFFDAFVQAAWQPERLHTKTSPADLFGDYRAKGSVLSIGTTVRLEF